MAEPFNAPNAEDVLAEFAAVSQALHYLLKARIQAQPNPPAFAAALLESGDKALGNQKLWGPPEARHDAIREKARARFADILSAAAPRSQLR